MVFITLQNQFRKNFVVTFARIRIAKYRKAKTVYKSEICVVVLLREYWGKHLTSSAVVFWVQRRTSSARGSGCWFPSPCIYSDRIRRYISPGNKLHSCSSRINVFIEELQFYKYWYYSNIQHWLWNWVHHSTHQCGHFNNPPRTLAILRYQTTHVQGYHYFDCW